MMCTRYVHLAKRSRLMGLTIWINVSLADEAKSLLIENTRDHRLIWAQSDAGLPRGESCGEADIIFGQPSVKDCIESERVRWVELPSAGYTRYDTPEFRDNFQAREACLTTASGVLADSCAQHVLAMMLALGRMLLPSHQVQLGERGWERQPLRKEARLLTGQTVLLLGYGSIGKRLVALLAPFEVKVYAVRRQTRSERGVKIISEESLSAAISEADHIVNVLPENDSTRGYVNARRLACCKRGARLYNIGRGTTVDEPAMCEALLSGQLGAAYLDVFQEEPLPPGHRLWEIPNCFVTPHLAGSYAQQDVDTVRHFLANLESFIAGDLTLLDRVI